MTRLGQGSRAHLCWLRFWARPGGAGSGFYNRSSLQPPPTLTSATKCAFENPKSNTTFPFFTILPQVAWDGLPSLLFYLAPKVCNYIKHFQVMAQTLSVTQKGPQNLISPEHIFMVKAKSDLSPDVVPDFQAPSGEPNIPTLEWFCCCCCFSKKSE